MHSKILHKPCQLTARGAFCISAAMKSQALESYLYGNPERVAEIRQAQKANEQRREAKRPTLSLKPRDGGWSEARKRAEALFSPADPFSVD